MSIKFSENEWAKIIKGACVCNDPNAFTDLYEVAVDLGDMGDITIDTTISWGEDPVIYTSATTEFGERVKRFPIKFCPLCGRRLRDERRETEEKA